ncbi:MAG: nitrogen fixation protein NifH [Patescibacteria group bacterium]
MSGWKSHLKADPTAWLLEDDNPSVAYIARTDLLGEAETDPEVMKARAAIMTRGAVPVILAAQDGGRWNAPGRHYVDKYTGTVWQLIILAEHYADGNDPRIQKACHYILQDAQDRESGGFAIHPAAKGGGRHSEVIPCLTGNMVWSLIRLGLLDDPRVQAGIDWIAKYQRFDDGIPDPPTGWPYDLSEACWGSHTCHMGAVKALKALAEIPEKRRTDAVAGTIAKGVDYLLLHRVFKKSHDLSAVAKPGWLKFQFPLMYQTDVLEIARILLGLNCRDPRLEESVALILSKQDEKGRWPLENTFNGKYIRDIETKGKPSKWITLNALRVLKKYFGE